MTVLFKDYIKIRLEHITGDEKLLRHDCCRRHLVDELLDIMEVLEKGGDDVVREDADCSV